MTHDDTVTEAFRMQHYIFWCNAKVTHHLRCLCVHQRHMFPLNTTLIELLMYKIAEFFPFFAMVHHYKMVAASYEVMGDVGWWPVAVDGAFLVEECLYETPVCDDDHIGWSKFEGEDTAILLRPFREPWEPSQLECLEFLFSMSYLK